MRIAIIQGHPDGAAGHFCHALAAAYAAGALEAGHEVRRIEIAQLDFPLLRSPQDWGHATPPDALRQAQADLAWAEHLVILYPLWLGAMPALLKAFFEQVLRPGFAVDKGGSATSWVKRLRGRSARIVVTMGMPAFIYRWVFGAHSLKSLERNILRFVGIAPLRETLIGSVESCGDARRRKWLDELQALGRKAR